MNITEFKGFYIEYFPVGEGWRPLVEKLVDDIMELDEDIEIAQTKQKFGGLRFYIYGGTDDVYELIEKAEAESYTICEQCGTKDEVTTKGAWIRTLCNKCRKKYNESNL